MTQEKDECREAFEARISSNGMWPRAVEKNRDGEYILMQTHHAWQEYQAGYQDALQAPSEAKGNGDQCSSCAPDVANGFSNADCLCQKAPSKCSRKELGAILTNLEFVEDRQIAIWSRGEYITWNDGEFMVSQAAKKLRALLAAQKGQ